MTAFLCESGFGTNCSGKKCRRLIWNKIKQLWGSRWGSFRWYLNAQWVWSCTIKNFTTEKSSSVSEKGWTLISNLHHNWNLLHRPPLLMRFSFCFQAPRKWHSCMHWQPPRQQASSPALVAMDNLRHVDVPDQPVRVSCTKTGHGADVEMTSSLDTSQCLVIKKELKLDLRLMNILMNASRHYWPTFWAL